MVTPPLPRAHLAMKGPFPLPKFRNNSEIPKLGGSDPLQSAEKARITIRVHLVAHICWIPKVAKAWKCPVCSFKVEIRHSDCQACLPSMNHPMTLSALSSCQHFSQAVAPWTADHPPVLVSGGLSPRKAESSHSYLMFPYHFCILWSHRSSGSQTAVGADSHHSHRTPKFPKPMPMDHYCLPA